MQEEVENRHNSGLFCRRQIGKLSLSEEILPWNTPPHPHPTPTPRALCEPRPGLQRDTELRDGGEQLQFTSHGRAPKLRSWDLTQSCTVHI